MLGLADAPSLTKAEADALYAAIGGGGGGSGLNVKVKTADYTAVANDYVLVTASTAPVTITIPIGLDSVVAVKKLDSTANTVTVRGVTGTIEGAATVVLNTQYDSRVFIGDGTNASVEAGDLAGAVRYDIAQTLTTTQQNRVLLAINAQAAGGAPSGVLLAANNLSDLISAQAARVHLGLPYFDTPEAHGAVADGATDDSVAIQNCITALSAIGGGLFMMLNPNAAYAVGAANGGPIMWTDGITCIAGTNTPKTGAITGRHYAGAELVVLSSWATDSYVIDTPTVSGVDTQVSNAAIIGLVIAAAAPTTTSSQRVGGIRFKKANYCTIAGCVVAGTSYAAINMANGLKNWVVNNSVQFFTQFRTLSVSEGALTVGGTDCWIQNNQCNGGIPSSGVGNVVQYPSAFLNCGLLLLCQTSWIIGNNGEFADTGVKVTGDFNSITGLRGDVNSGRGITFEGAIGNTCSDLLIITNSTASSGTYDGLYLDAGSYGNVITGISASQIAGSTVLMRTIVNNQSNLGASPSLVPYLPNRITGVKADWSLVALDLVSELTPTNDFFDSLKAGPGHMRPASRHRVGGMYWDNVANLLTVSDGVSWRDIAGVRAANLLTAQQSEFALGTTAGWGAFQSTIAGLVAGFALCGRPSMLQFSPASAGVTADLAGVQATSVAVRPGEYFTPVSYMWSQVAITGELSISWFTAALVLIGGAAVAAGSFAVPAGGATATKMLGQALQAPPNAAFAVLNVLVQRPSGGLTLGDVIKVGKNGLLVGNTATDWWAA